MHSLQAHCGPSSDEDDDGGCGGGGGAVREGRGGGGRGGGGGGVRPAAVGGVAVDVSGCVDGVAGLTAALRGTGSE